MKIAIMGTGGVGGYYGGLLAQTGQDVTFVVRRKPDGKQDGVVGRLFVKGRLDFLLDPLAVDRVLREDEQQLVVVTDGFIYPRSELVAYL